MSVTRAIADEKRKNRKPTVFLSTTMRSISMEYAIIMRKRDMTRGYLVNSLSHAERRRPTSGDEL